MNTKSGDMGRWWRLAVVALVGAGVMQAAGCTPTPIASPGVTQTAGMDPTDSLSALATSAPIDQGVADPDGGDAELPYEPDYLDLIGAVDRKDLKTVMSSVLGGCGYAIASFDVVEELSYPPFGDGALALTTDTAIARLIRASLDNKELTRWLVRIRPGAQGGTMEDFSGCINNDDGQPLVASPNYLVKSAASKAKVHPWDGRPGTANVSEDDYSTQPMFGAMRCDSTTPAIGCSSPPEQLTDGFVAVGVFDTSPYFTVPGPDSYGHGSITVQAGAQAFPLELINDSSSRLPDLEQGPFLDFNDHGVFVSSIVAAMAPEAELTLYRSFNDQGAGYSATIGKHMVHFVPVPQQGEAPPPRVVNISGQFAGTSGSSTTFDADLVSVVSRGAVVVASAGNGNPTLPQGYPASSPNVVGISGVNSSRTSACFSNKADPYLGAYSGDGDGTCQTYDEDESVIGLIPYPMRSQTSFTFARWAGTSFASAIISAQAARELNHWNTCDPNFMADLTKVGTRQATFATDVSAYKWSALPDSVEVVNLAAMDTNCH